MGDAVVGNRTKVKVVKNKLASPFREAEFDIIYGEGISREERVMVDLGAQHNVIEKSGSWFSIQDRLGGADWSGTRERPPVPQGQSGHPPVDRHRVAQGAGPH